MNKKTWEEKIRKDYKSIFSEEQIEETIKYWNSFLSSELLLQRENDVREMALMMENWHGNGRTMVEDYAKEKGIIIKHE